MHGFPFLQPLKILSSCLPHADVCTEEIAILMRMTTPNASKSECWGPSCMTGIASSGGIWDLNAARIISTETLLFHYCHILTSLPFLGRAHREPKQYFSNCNVHKNHLGSASNAHLIHKGSAFLASSPERPQNCGPHFGEQGIREMTATVFSYSPGIVNYNWIVGELLQDEAHMRSRELS